jgi:hypothetical protein
MTRRYPVFLALLITFGLEAADADAQCGVVANFSGYPLENGTSISLINNTPSVFSTQDLQHAQSQWTTCGGAYGTQFPAIDIGGSGRPVYIEHVPGRNPNPGGACERVEHSIAGHTLISATITIYTQQGNGTSCLPLSEDIAHAIGHIFGLGDATSSGCGGTLMGARPAGGTRSPAGPAECTAADMGYEMLNPEPEPNGGGPGGGTPPCV